MNEMIAGKTLNCNTFTDEFIEMDTEEQDLYLFLRGGLIAK